MPFLRRKLARWLGAAFLVLLALIAAAYWHFYVNIVTIENRSDSALMNARIVMANPGVWETGMWTGTVSAHDRVTAFGVPKSDGDLYVSFDVAGRSVHQGVAYVTPGISGRYVVTVSPDLKVHVEEASK